MLLKLVNDSLKDELNYVGSEWNINDLIYSDIYIFLRLKELCHLSSL